MNDTTMDGGTLAGAYLGMAQLFSYPNSRTWKHLTGQGLVDPELAMEALEAEYMAAFETGRDGPAVSLFEGMHRGDLGRDGILEGLLRFYEFFDIKLSETDREYPDHLVTELEFLAWLCLQDRAAQEKGGDAQSFRRAARDFLDRHLALWLPVFRQRLAATGTTYANYGADLADLVQAHLEYLECELLESGGTQ